MDAISPVGVDAAQMNILPALSAKANPHANIDASAQDFEAMFATTLLKPMFDTIPVNSMFGGGNGEEVMRTFLLQEYGKIIAKTGILNIAPQVKTELIRAQEGARGSARKTDKVDKSSSEKGSGRVASR
ncbi:MAG: rod-binding protein [Alphaproteobacteria bacterium]|nr:rod-binding protein [Alphaproteobacteria bacterium]